MVFAKKNWQFLLSRGSVALVAAGALLLPACANNQPQATAPNEPTQQEQAVNEQREETLEKVAENPTQMVGQTVTVKGEVEQVYDPNSFILQDDELFGGEKVLVITPRNTTPVQDDQQVQVTGEVRQFVLAEFEREYDLTWDGALKQKIEAEYKDKPVIVAQSLQANAQENAQ